MEVSHGPKGRSQGRRPPLLPSPGLLGRSRIRGEAAVSLAMPCCVEMGRLRDESPLFPGSHPGSDPSPPGNQPDKEHLTGNPGTQVCSYFVFWVLFFTK